MINDVPLADVLQALRPTAQRSVRHTSKNTFQIPTGVARDAILVCVWTMGPQFLSLPLRYAWYLVGAYFCIPVIGFYCSLLTRNVLVAWLLTLFFAQYLPYAITETFRFDIGRRHMPLAFFAVQTTFALLAGILLYENLIKRRFVLRS